MSDGTSRIAANVNKGVQKRDKSSCEASAAE
jgi:hypothetical protein